MMKKILFIITLLTVAFSFSQEKEAVNETVGYLKLKENLSIEKKADSFEQRIINADGSTGGVNIKGNITFIANSILSKYKKNGNSAIDPNDPYDGNDSNGSVDMQYIDIDGDDSTFSSSSDELNLPTCSRVVYAGLYWAGVYPYETWDGEETRSEEFNKIKFRLPGALNGYEEVEADATDVTKREVIFNDGFTYICYKDITTDIQELRNEDAVTGVAADPDGHNGTYFAADIRGIRGEDEDNGLGGSAGWTMVVIYENETESSKNISVFDGFAEVYNGNDVPLAYSGFVTVPVGPDPANPAPVRVTLLAATLEGDKSIPGDRFQIENTAGTYISQSTTNINPINNFFNGSISQYDNYVTSRTPDSENTLGIDVDLYELDNSSNGIITNNQTTANVQFVSTGDVYWPFLNALAVEIIEPEVRLIKTIQDAAGNDISGASVTLGSELFYNIRFQNVGTDNATNTEIFDLLPKNVDFISADLILPPELEVNRANILSSYIPPAASNGFRGKLTFEIPDDIVKEGGTFYDIKIKVQVVSDCNDLRDVCSNEILNQAFSKYEGVRGGIIVDNEPSFAGIDDCNFGIVGTSNFLIDIDDCDFERTEVLCGTASLDLIAGSGFDSYQWVDQNGNNAGNTQTITVNTIGTYTVTKTTSLGCITKPEIVNVISFANVTNPLIAPFADQILPVCNGFELAEVYLCGTDSRDITLPFTGLTTVNWFKLDDAANCATTLAGCANLDADPACTWTGIGTELNKTFSEAGQYRLEVDYDGRCPKTYYFNVYKATLAPTIVKEDLLCGAPGKITINGVPSGYEYMLTGPGVTTPAFQTSNVFNVTAAGDYNYIIRLIGAPAASCTYTFPSENIQSTDIGLNLPLEINMQCANGATEIVTQVLDVPGPYTYTLSEGGLTVGSPVTKVDREHIFNVTEGGIYSVTVTTAECSITKFTEVIEPDVITLSAVTTKNISCKDGTSNGIVTLTGSGGTLDGTNTYSFAVVSINGIAEPLPRTYFKDTTYEVALANSGIYVFEIVDSNNCSTEATATVTIEPELQFNYTPTNVSCNGLTDGTIVVETNPSPNVLNYDLEYSIDGWISLNNTGVFTGLSANTYTISIRASKTNYLCTYEITNVMIANPPILEDGSVLETDHSCDISGNTILGTLTFTAPTGGTGAYTYYYKLSTSATYIAVTGTTVSGLAAGTYNTRVNDERNCSIDLNDVIIDPIPGAPTFNSAVIYNCEGEGTITITPYDASYTYTLDSGTPQTGVDANVFENIGIGAHSIRVSYFGDCRIDLPVTVATGNIFSGSIERSSDSECFGSNNGTITIRANNPIGGSFEYSTDAGATWSITSDNPYRVIGLAADTYSVFIREVDGGKTCTIDLGDVPITEPDELTLSASVSTVPTCGVPEGTITAVATGGIIPYEFSIDGGVNWQTSPIFSNLPVSVTPYIVMVRDDRNCNECGCTANLFENGSFELPTLATKGYRVYGENDVPGWDSTASDNRIEIWYNNFGNVTAHDGVAHAELNANLESSLYQEYCTQPGDVISWSVAHRGRAGTDVATVKIGDDLATASVVETMSDGTSAWGVYSGTYIVPVGQSTTVIAFDAVSTATGSISVGNFIDDVKITIARNNCIPVSIPLLEPTPITFTAVPSECIKGNNGTITVDVTTGNDDYQFILDGATPVFASAATPDRYVFENLASGSHTIDVIDGLSCNATQQIVIIEDELKLSIDSIVDVICGSGTVNVSATGGDSNYVYQIVTTGGTFTATTTFTNLAALLPGDYDVYVRDNNGDPGFCQDMITVTVNAGQDLAVTATPIPPNCSGELGSIDVVVSGGQPNYIINLLNTVTNVTTVQTLTAAGTHTFNNLTTGVTYRVTVEDVSICANSFDQFSLLAPNAISGDTRQSQDYLCGQLGEITVENVLGGTPPYTYTLSDGTTTTTYTTDTVTFDYIFEDLEDGVYTVEISDVNTCSFTTTPSITILALPEKPTFSNSITYNCDGTGTITLTQLTPAAPGTYNYTLGGTTNTTGIFSGLSDGSYTVTVDYGRGCTVDVTNITVLDNQEFTAVVTNQTNPVCIGDTNGTIEVTASFPSTTPADFEYSLNGAGFTPAGANPFTIPNLSDGTHNIVIRPIGSTTDCNITLDPVVLSDPDPIVVAATVTKDITCDTDLTLDGATITITPTTSGGNGATYTYELFDNAAGTLPAVQTGAPFTDIDTAGDYWVVAIDVESCRSTPVLVNVPVKENVTFDLAPEICYDGTNGTITVNNVTGNGNYLYSLDGGTTTQASNVFTGLTNGTYNVTVIDGFGCEDTVSSTINAQVTATIVPTNEICNALGQIAITPSGGDGNYQYEIVPIAPAGTTITSTTSPVSLSAGTYTVNVRDQGGSGTSCLYSENIEIRRIVDPTVVVTPTQPDCSGQTGSVDIVISNGTANYTTTLTLQTAPGTVHSSGPSSDTTISFGTLAEGTYDVLVTDANGCTNSLPEAVTITAPNAISGDTRQSQDYLCGQLGEITVENVLGGTPPYTYTLSDGTTTTTYTTDTVTFDYIFEDLEDGVYTVEISDVNTCSFTTTPSITILALPEKPTFSNSITYNCDGTGTITLTQLTPAAPGTYNYTLGGTTNTTGIFSGLSDGSYTVTVDYGRGCTVDVTNITVLDNQEFTAVVTNQTNPVCIGDTNGTIEVTASFPSTTPADFEYSLNGAGFTPAGANPFTISNLSDGTHNIVIRPIGSTTDCNITLDPVVLSDPDPIVVAATVTKDITCDTDLTLDGATITITPTTSGGNGATYTYELFDNAAGTLPAVQTGAPFTDIDTAGDYWVVAIDVESCRSTPVLVNVPVKETIVFTAVPQCYDGANGIIDVDITNGNGGYEYSLDGTNWTSPTPANATLFSITGLSNIGYTVSIRDIAGCIETETATINDAVTAIATPTNASCTTGQILVTPSGGSAAGYEFSIVADGAAAGTYAATNPTIGLVAGTYDVFVRDNAGCGYKIEDVVIAPVTPVVITAASNQPTCNGNTGSIDGVITASTGQAPHTITIANSGGIIVASTLTGFTGTNFSFNNLPAETYTITITDALGCSDSKTETLTNPPAILMNIEPILSADCITPIAADTGFDFNFKAFTLASYSPYSLEYSLDNGATWLPIIPAMHSVSVAPHPTPGDNLYSVRGLTSGQTYSPSIRIVDGATTRCQVDNGIFVMPFQVEGIVVDITPAGNCVLGYSITVEAIGGTGPFEFGISTEDPINTNTWHAAISNVPTDPDYRKHIFTDIIPGLNYLFYVKDANGCIQTNDPNIPIVFPDSSFDVNITPTASSQSCNGTNSGALSFLIDDLDSVLFGEDLNWELYNGVTDTTLGITGTIANTVTYPFTLNSVGTPVAALQSLSAGIYYIVIEVDSGTPTSCKWASGDIEIKEGQPIVGTLNPLNDITCSADGTVRIENVTGGFGGYTYQVTGATNTTGLTFPITVTGTTFNIAYANVDVKTLPVNITITATDVNGCSATLTPNPVILNVSQLPVIVSTTPSSCGITKTITTRVNSGTAPYQFSVNGGAFSGDVALSGGFAEFTTGNLAPGNHIITVRDANGCTVDTASTTIQPSLEYTVNLTKNLTCAPVPLEATYDISVTNGSGNYTYEITRFNGGANTNVEGGAAIVLPPSPYTFSTAIADVYTITIRDTAETPNCTITKTFTVADALQPVFTTNVVDATCNGGANGSIGISVTAGLTPYTYSIVQTAGTGLLAGQATWDAASNSFIAVPAGTYTVTVTGDNGCATDELNIVVNDNPLLTVTAPVAVQFACAANTNTVNNATLSINALDTFGVSGGSTVYSMVRLYHDVLGNNPADNSTNRADDIEVTTVTVTGTNHVFSIIDVAGGSYYVEVVDSASCMSLSASTIINTFDAIADITIGQSKAIDCTTGDNITVKTTTDIANVTYNIISAPAGYVGSTLETAVLATDSVIFTDLPTGTYEITATHPATGCVFTKEYTVATEPAFTVIANNAQTTCFGLSDGSVDVSFNVSTPYTLGYSYEVLTSGGASLVPAVAGNGVGNATETIGGLPAGTYYVSINMSPNTPFCTIQTNEFTIVEPTAILSVTGIVDPGVSCTGVSDARITATGSAGFGGYTYQLEDSAAPNVPYRAGDAFATNLNNNVFTGLPAGSYTIRVRDVNGCEGTTAAPVVVAPAIPVSFVANDIDNSCDTSVGGSVTVTAAGGTLSYTYVLTNSVGTEVGNTGVIASGTHTFANLSADDYTVSVTDSNGCTAPAGGTITINENLVFRLDTTKDLTCSAPMAGTVVITVASGSNNYTYEVTGPSAVVAAGSAFISGQTFSPTVAGTYTVTVTDEDASPAACSVVRTIDIADALQPVFTTNVVDATCNGGANGSIGISVTAGLTPYTYSIVQTAGTGLLAGQATWDAASNSFIAVPAGTYTVTVTGDNGCATDELNIVVNDNPLLTVTAPVAVQFACAANTNTVNNATLSINALDTFGVSGGSTVYSMVRLYHDVLGNNPADNSTNRADDIEVTTVTVTGTNHVFSIIDVAGGSYYVEVVDSSSCMSLSASTIINTFDAIADITIGQSKAIDCTTGDNITVKTTTDIANVTYNIISAPAGYVGSTLETAVLATDSVIFTDLPTGTYEITATHPATGCVFTKEYTVATEPVFTVIANNAQTTCFGLSDGSVDVSFNVSTPYTLGYSYEVLTSGGASLVPAVAGNGVGNATETIGGLPAGTYYVSINMSPNTPFCTIQTNEFTIVEPTAILSVTGIVDPGVSCTGVSDARITATGSAGFGGYTYQLEDSAAPNVPYRAGDAFATNLNNNVFTGLPAGSYTIRVRDVNGCEGTTAAPVVVAPAIPVSFVANDIDNSCDTSVGGSVTVTAAGGTLSYTYVLTNSVGTEVGNTGVIASGTHTFANLSADDYTVSVTDSNGCTAPAGGTITINENLVFRLDTTKDLTCSAPMAGTVVITVASGSNNYTYEVTGPSAVVAAGSAFISGQTFSPTVAGTYTVTVTDEDASPAACSVVRTIDIADALQPVFTTNVVDATCNGGANGSIGISVTAGLTPYTYSIVQTAGTGLLAGQATWDAASNSFIAVPAGTYTVTVTGDNGCATDELNIVVNDNPLLTVTAPVAVQFACAANTNTVNNATLSINALDTFGVSGGSTVYSMVRLYHDVLGNNPADNSTNRADDIEVTTVTVTGTNHVFSIIDVAGGSYYVEVVDSSSCMSLSASTIINTFDAIADITIGQSKAIDCTTGDNITVKTTTDIANVTYNIISAPAGYVGSTLETAVLATDSVIFTDLPTGTYEITATHPATGCVFTKEYTVATEPVFTVIANNAQTTCFGLSDGSVDVSFNVSTPYTLGYSYEVLTSGGASLVPAVAGNGVGNATETIGGLPAGTYYVSINMSPNTPFCTIQTNEFTIVEPTAILSVTGIVDPGVSCTGVSDARITATGSAGFGGYTYQLEDSAAPNVPYRAGDAFATNLNNNVFTGLPAGSYTIRVRDVNGCEGTTAAPVVVAPAIPVSIVSVTDVDNSCLTNTGEITVVATGGTGTYTYLLINGAGNEVGRTQVTSITHTFSSLNADTYTVSVTDSNGCAAPAVSPVTIDPKLDFTINVTKDLTCNPTPNAEITINLTNYSASSNYEIEVDGAVDGLVNIGGGVITRIAIGVNPLVLEIPSTNIASQLYTVTIYDLGSNPNCDISQTIEILPAKLPDFTAIAVVDNICNGSSDGVIRVNSVDNGILPLSYAINNMAGTYNALPVANEFANLIADDYIITATGDNGCTSVRNVTINENGIIDISGAITTTQFGCTLDNTTNSATISVNTTGVGGTNNFVKAIFEFVPADGSATLTQNSGVFNYTITNESGGDVTITVYDDNNCSDTEVRTIDPFARITGIAITSQKAIDCRDGEDILVVLESTRAIPNFEYRLYDNVTGLLVEPVRTNDGDFITLLPTGVYKIEVENTDTDCIYTEFHTVIDPPKYELIVDEIQRACFGSTARVNLSFNATTPYTDVYDYEVFIAGGTVSTGIIGNGIGNVTTTVNNLPAGNYYITVTMPNTPFCTSISGDFEIVQPATDLTLTEELTYLKCGLTQTDSGEVKLIAVGGWGTHQFELINTTTSTTIQTFANNNTIVGLTPGNYEATVRDANNCTQTINFQLDEGIPITGNYTVIPNNCIGEMTATISVATVGGQLQAAPLTYSYILEYPNGTRSTSQSSASFTNLPAGIGYSVIVSDGYSCDGRIGPIDIIDPTKVEALANITADITCNTPEAIVEVIGSGGTGPYMFSEDGINFNSTPIFNVGAGEHQFYVRDIRMCVSDPKTVSISNYNPLTVVLDTSLASITCNGNANAVLSANADNGFGNYEYLLLDGADVPITNIWQSSNYFDSLDVGTYKIRVRSINRFGVECFETTREYTITQPVELTGTALATRHVTCFDGSTGIITATGFDGNGGYQFNLVSVPANTLYPGNKFVDNGVFENLTAGTYYVTIKDVTGCTILPPIEVVITQPEELLINASITQEQVCKNDPSPIITVNVQGGTTPYFISVNNGTFIEYSTSVISLTNAEGIVTGVNNLITVKDSGVGCANKFTQVKPVQPIDLKFEAKFNYKCEVGNVIELIVDDKYRNNMSYTLYDGAGNIEATVTGSDAEFTNVPAGNGYYVIATNTVTSCSEDSRDNPMSDPIDIEDIQALEMTIDHSTKNMLIANVDFGLPPYEYSIDGSDFVEGENEFTILQTKEYTITVRDARGCEVTLTVKGVYISIVIPNYFTPNGDNENDFWYPSEVEAYHELEVLIYDRYARKIKLFKGAQQGWDGLYEGKPLPTGDYWYTIYYKELSGQKKKLMGHFTLYR